MLSTKLKATIRDIKDFPKKGIFFKDITPILMDYKLCNEIVDDMICNLKETTLDAVVGIESRGFLLGILIANKLNLPFIPVRKKGKLPYKVISRKYDLEYGTAELEIHTDSIKKNWNILLHDDLLATGGTASAASMLINDLGANVSAFAFIVELKALNGRKNILKYCNKIITSTNF